MQKFMVSIDMHSQQVNITRYQQHAKHKKIQHKHRVVDDNNNNKHDCRSVLFALNYAKYSHSLLVLLFACWLDGYFLEYI